MKTIFSLIILLSVITSCKEKRLIDNNLHENQDALLLSVLWYQKSAEMQALYYQGYNIAKYSILQSRKSYTGRKPLAVVMDIDETVLDNSPVESYQILNNVSFSPSLWKRWVNKSSAEPCPGALEFTRFADSLKVEIFYVTNRELPDEYLPTLLNLKNAGFPFADTVHLLLKSDSNSKDLRRTSISERFEIILLIGDNLADFDTAFDNRGEDLGSGSVIQRKNLFGKKYIILPNPMYGPWLNAAVNKTGGKTVKEKILNTLRSF